MTRRTRWPVVVEVRNRRTRGRERRQSTGKTPPVSKAAISATPIAETIKNEPEAAFPSPGPLARNCSPP